MLFLSAWSLVGAFIILAVIFRKQIVVPRLQLFALASVGIAVLVGFTAGWGRSPWSSLDIPAWLSLVVLLVSVYFIYLSRDSRLFFWPDIFYFLAAFLLGWQILLPAFGLYVILKYMPVDSTNEWQERAVAVVSWLALSGICLAFVRRGDAVSGSMFELIIAMGIWTAMAWSLKSIKDFYWKYALGFLILFCLSSILAQSFSFLIFGILELAGIWAVNTYKPGLKALLPELILAWALVMLIISIWVPMLLNPKLVPF